MDSPADPQLPHTDTGHDASGAVPCVRLNLDQHHGGWLAVAVLTLFAIGAGSGATSLLVSLIQSRSVNAQTVVGSIALMAVAIAIRFASIHTWRLRARERRLRAHSRRALDEALASGIAPDMPTLCWSIAKAAGCTNTNMRRLTLERLLEVEARLHVRLPRVWVTDGSLSKVVAELGSSPGLPNGTHGATRPVQASMVAADLIGFFGLLATIVWTVLCVATVVFAPRAGSLSTFVLLLASPVLAGGGVFVTVAVLLRWARRRRRQVEIDASGIHQSSSIAPEPLAFAPDGFTLLFHVEDFVNVSMPWNRAVVRGPGPRARLLAPHPWTTVEIAVDSTADPAAVERERRRNREFFDSFKPIRTLGSPLRDVARFALPPSPPPLASAIATCAFVLACAGAASWWWLTPGRKPGDEAYIVCAIAGAAGFMVLAATIRTQLLVGLPRRRAIAARRRVAQQTLTATPPRELAADIPQLCRLIAAAHACSDTNLRPLSYERLKAAEARFGVKLPPVWAVYSDTAHGRAAFTEIGTDHPALYRVTDPPARQDRARRRTNAALLGVAVLGTAVAAGMIPGVPWPVGAVSTCCGVPVMLVMVLSLVGPRSRRRHAADGQFLLLSHSGPRILRGFNGTDELTRGPADCFTLVFEGGGMFVPPGHSWGPTEDDEDDDDDIIEDVPDNPLRRGASVRVVGPRPWGEVEGIPCFAWIKRPNPPDPDDRP